MRRLEDVNDTNKLLSYKCRKDPNSGKCGSDVISVCVSILLGETWNGTHRLTILRSAEMTAIKPPKIAPFIFIMTENLGTTGDDEFKNSRALLEQAEVGVLPSLAHTFV